MNKRTLVRFGLALMTGTLPLAALAQDMKELNFGIISTEASSNLRKDWQPILDDLAMAGTPNSGAADVAI